MDTYKNRGCGLAKGIRRTALSLALGACFVGHVYAQSAVGSIFGDANGGSKVTIQNLDTGLSREITVDANGRFAFSQLPTGRYRVTSDGVSRDVTVTVGTGAKVDLVAAAGGATELDAITVMGTAINPIDVSSVESTTVFTAEQIQKLPVARDITSVALLAPGTVKGDTGLGNLASFGGASVAENGYYINGFDVTNLRSLLSYANVPFDAIGEQQIKTGGYSAEYGRALGGVISLVTKRGTNEWKSGFSLYWTPESLQEQSADVFSRDPDAAGEYYIFRSADRSSELTYNVYSGGPLVKDRLFVFGLLEGRHDQRDVYSGSESFKAVDKTPNGLIKLDWNITDDHILEFTGIRNYKDEDFVQYSSQDRFSPNHQTRLYDYTQKSGGTVYIGKYTGYLTDNFTLAAQAGRLNFRNPYIPGGVPGEDCPTVYDGRNGVSELIPLGCWPTANFAGVRPVNAPPDEDTRDAYRLDVEWRVGSHTLRGGLDYEKFESTFTASNYAGLVYYRYFDAPANGTTNGVANDQEYVRRRTLFRSNGAYEVINKAAYLEDSWQITDNFVGYLGLRWEAFDNKNADGVSFVKADDLFAPRLGFSWDVNGDSTFKLFGNAGRYYIPVASNTSIRASGAEQTTDEFFQFSAIDPTTGAPTLGTQLGVARVNGSTSAPLPATVAAANLDPMYQDEYILGFQAALSDLWSVGLRAIHREIKSGFDDTCSHQAFQDWADDNGYADFDYSSMASCYLINPGRDVEMAVDVNGDGNLVNVTIPAHYFGLPKYRRKYSAMEFFFERSLVNGLYLQGSYTYAKSKGNAEGYVNSTLEQADAGITQDFDFAAFTKGAYGYLPNDRRHTFKLFGSYQMNEEWRIGGNVLVQSGRPISCNGYIPESDEVFQGIDGGTAFLYSASSFYCHDANGVPTLGSRGDRGRTPWVYDFDVSLAYEPKFAEGLTLQVDVFNVFNIQKVTEYNETGDRNRAAPERDPNFLNIVNYQEPRSVRFTVRYDF